MFLSVHFYFLFFFMSFGLQLTRLKQSVFCLLVFPNVLCNYVKFIFVSCVHIYYFFFAFCFRMIGPTHVGVRQGVASENGLQAVPDPEAEPLLVDAPEARRETVEPQQLPHGHDSGVLCVSSLCACSWRFFCLPHEW